MAHDHVRVYANVHLIVHVGLLAHGVAGIFLLASGPKITAPATGVDMEVLVVCCAESSTLLGSRSSMFPAQWWQRKGLVAGSWVVVVVVLPTSEMRSGGVRVQKEGWKEF